MNLPKVAVLLLALPGLTLAQDCGEIEDNSERLACYDAGNAEASGAPAGQREPSAPADPQVLPVAPPAEGPAGTGVGSAATIEAEKPEDFGAKEPIDAPREYIEATIVEIAESADIHYLRLDNGQVWREVEDSRLRFKLGREVTITEGVMGSFDLKMEGQNKIVKVRRIR